MTQKEKLVQRFKSLPKDFTVDELTSLMRIFGFDVSNKGATSGSRMAYINNKTKDIIRIHKPNPGKIKKIRVLKDILKNLEEHGFLYQSSISSICKHRTSI